MIYRCQVCHKFTLKEEHCQRKTLNIKPVKFSYTDKLSKYRLKAKGYLK